MQEQEKDFLQGYELRNWNFSPRIYKILAFSAIFNVLFILTVAQANLLTRKGCDSPLVNKVCSVLDTIYVSSVLLGTDSDFVSKEYLKTDLEDDVTEVTWISRDDQLVYPPGYFALANPQQFQPEDPINQEFPTSDSSFPVVIPTPTPAPQINNQPVLRPQRTPKPGKIVTNVPDSLFGDDTEKTKPDPKATPKPKEDVTAKNDDKKPEKDPTDIKSDPERDFEINKEPLKDLADTVVEKWANKEVDLSKSFLVEMQGALKKEKDEKNNVIVKFDKDKSKFVKSEGEEQLVNIAKEAIEAIGDSGWMGYLDQFGVKKVNFTLTQNENELIVVVSADQQTPERAKTLSSQLNNVISVALLLDKNGVKPLDADGKTLLSNAKVTNEGKVFQLNMTIPKPIAQEMINRKLQEAQQAKKQQEQKPSSSSQSVKTNPKTGE